MSVVVLFLVLGAIGFACVSVVLGIIVLRLPAPESRTVHWQQVAKKLRAELSTSGWWRATPTLRLVYREAKVTVGIQAARHTEGTRLSLRHPSLALTATIGSTDLVSPPAGPGTASPVALIPDLTAAGWAGWTPEPNLASRWITPAVQAQLVQLHQAVRPYGVRFRAAAGLLQIDVDRPLWAFDSLHQLIRSALAIYDQFLLASAEGIAFVEPEELRPLEAVCCRVCGEQIERELVVCRSCKTPHHRECWEYIGQCSTYACGERSYVVPRAGEAK